MISPWAIEILAFPSRQYVQSVKSSHYDFKDPGRSHRGSNIAETFASLDGRLEFGYSDREYTGKVLTLSFRAVYSFASRFVLEVVQKHSDVCFIVPE